jgi:ribosomal protein S12 methylthiotransferase accessory factor YcaO
MHSNGKGMTKDFCLASAYAELFERFCNNSNEAYATLSQYDIK